MQITSLIAPFLHAEREAYLRELPGEALQARGRIVTRLLDLLSEFRTPTTRCTDLTQAFTPGLSPQSAKEILEICQAHAKNETAVSKETIITRHWRSISASTTLKGTFRRGRDMTQTSLETSLDAYIQGHDHTLLLTITHWIHMEKESFRESLHLQGQHRVRGDGVATQATYTRLTLSRVLGKTDPKLAPIDCRSPMFAPPSSFAPLVADPSDVLTRGLLREHDPLRIFARMICILDQSDNRWPAIVEHIDLN